MNCSMYCDGSESLGDTVTSAPTLFTPSSASVMTNASISAAADVRTCSTTTGQLGCTGHGGGAERSKKLSPLC